MDWNILLTIPYGLYCIASGNETGIIYGKLVLDSDYTT